jgi:hypothetical protein
MIVGAAEDGDEWAIDKMVMRHMVPFAFKLVWDTAKGDYDVVAADEDMARLYYHYFAEVDNDTVAETKAAATA